MSSTIIATVTEMIETLPETTQIQVVDHLRAYIAEMRDESQWDTSFKKTQEQLMTAARYAKEEIAAGQAKSLDYDRL